MSLPAPDRAELGFQVGDHVCAFYNGGNSLDDIVVDYLSKGLEAGDLLHLWAGLVGTT